MRITAVSGWAIPTDWFSEQIQKYFINSEVNVIYPSNPFDTEEARRQLYEKPADLYLGYSLGSLWMFRHRELFPKKSIRQFSLLFLHLQKNTIWVEKQLPHN